MLAARITTPHNSSPRTTAHGNSARTLGAALVLVASFVTAAATAGAADLAIGDLTIGQPWARVTAATATSCSA